MALQIRTRESAGQLTALTLARYTPAPGRLVMPDVCCDLVWGREGLVITGPQTQARPSRNVGVEVTLLRLDPFSIWTWLGIPLSELTDRAVKVADIDGGLARDLDERRSQGLLAELVPSVQAFHIDGRISAATNALQRGARVSVSAEAAGLSERQLERLFVERTGLAPKTYARIVRFRRAMQSVHDGVSISLASADAGYSDQAHFSRDVRGLTGETPSSLRQRYVGNVQDIIAGSM